MASASGSIEIINYLLDAKAKVNTRAPDGKTPLIIALDTDRQCAKAIINAKADVNIVNDAGHTPLIIACRKSYIDIVEVLLKSHDDIPINQCFNHERSCSCRGYTALSYASHKGCVRNVELLLKYKSDIDIKAGGGYTPLILSAFHDRFDIVKLLLESMADPDLTSNTGKTARDYIQINFNKITEPVIIIITPVIKYKQRKRKMIIDIIDDYLIIRKQICMRICVQLFKLKLNIIGLPKQESSYFL